MSEVLSYCNSYIFERGGAYLATSEFYKEMIIFQGTEAWEKHKEMEYFCGA